MTRIIITVLVAFGYRRVAFRIEIEMGGGGK
jgi:hypothetical protein